MGRLFLSAAHKSSGKTSISVGLAAALSATGHKVQTFKKGPDYIDPMWLAWASGRVCYNLDFNTQSNDEILRTFGTYAPDPGLSLIEGNKGLFDGVDVEGADCSAALAKLLNAPVVLILDTVGITRGIAPLVQGYVNFDPEVRIAGIVLNRVASSRQEGKLRKALELYTDTPILGAIGRDRSLEVSERHLGLTTPQELEAAPRKIDQLREAIENGVDLEGVLAAARTAPALRPPGLSEAALPESDVVIAVARDSAFSFYYPDDLEAFERAGARLEFFSPLTDAKLSEADGLFLGGGFPETHMRALESNAAMREQVRTFAGAGKPVYAECGGLMYLAQSISWNGATADMAGVIPGRIELQSSPQGRGLTVLEETSLTPWPRCGGEQASFSAHEFHYARLVDLVEDECAFAWTVKRGHGITGRHDGVIVGNVLAGFCHQRHTAQNPWVDRFVAHVRQIRASCRPD